MTNESRWIEDLSTLLLDVNDLVLVLDDVGLDSFMDELIADVRSSIGGLDPANVETHRRAGFSYDHPEPGMIEWMPTMLQGDIVSVKTVGYHPGNPRKRRVSSVLATTAIYDTDSGALVALTEATLLTALRTGAVSAAVTDAVTPDAPIVLGVVGCGSQAVTQIHAISRVRQISQLVVTDIDLTIAETLGSRLPAGIAKPEIHPSRSFNRLVDAFDVLVTATSVGLGDGPVVDLTKAADHLHINAVGADFPGKTELPADYVRQAVVIPDFVDQCLVQGEAQCLQASELGPDIVEVLSRDWDSLSNQQTIFDSTGWAYEDLIATRLFLTHAIRLGLGRSAQLQRVPQDPYDPYESVRSSKALRPDGQTLHNRS